MQGDNLLGESLPKLLRNVSLEDIEIRQNDRALRIVPPYVSPFEQAQVDEADDAVLRNLALWDLTTTKRYWLATGGEEAAFTEHWSIAMAHRRKVAEAIRAETYVCAGGGVFYLAWGWRPV